jgi:signal transduction histidine kinase
MRRLSLKIFLAVLGSLVVFAIAVSAAWWWNVQARDDAFEKRLAGELAAEILPASAAGPEQLRRVLERWNRRAGIDLTVLDEDRRVVAWAGRRLALEPPQGRGPGREGQPHRGRLAAFDIELPDGRRLLARPNRPRSFGPKPVSLGMALGLLMLAGAVVAWPNSRRITQRLERLQRGVDLQGAGDLAARVAVEGHDEVAGLARSFNQSAGRIESLVTRQEALLASQKRLLANASHELRSPLARIRMAMELLLARPQDSQQLADELGRNVAELDQLVDEILLASRLETTAPAHEEVDLAGLAAEEGSRVQAEVDVADGQAMLATGDSRLLRRLLRNLLENARRYGGAAAEPIRVVLSRNPGGIRIEVLDRGPGVPPGARERIFEAFYRVEGYSEQAGGVGLGLALVKQIAEAHGGKAACEAREGGGSRFVVDLPAA